MAFKPREQAEVVPDTPEKLFPLLPRTGENRPGLWYQQTDMLRDYVDHEKTRDLAIELPTGTGKTLTGLLIAEWRRRQGRRRAVFACPTVQLVRQVIAAAEREGIAVVNLTGKWANLDPADISKYESGRAIAVVAYPTVFNLRPKLGTPDVIVFDDAHAGEQYVSKAYTVSIDRGDLPSVHEDLVEALKPGLTAERHAQLIMNTPGFGTRKTIDAIFPALRNEWLEPIDRALVRLDEIKTREAKEQSYRYGAIRGQLQNCNIYVTWDKVEIRPAVAPTFQNTVFSTASQRIYLSATLGSSGELERAFGRPKIKRLRLPETAPKPKSGRRFVVFPHLVPDVDPAELTKRILSEAERAVIITPSGWAAIEAKDTIVPDNWKTMNKDDVADSFEPFARSKKTACILANRYDGIDLPDQACRVVALYGLPRATSLHEEFLSSKARSAAAIEERIRTRVVQGTGRCTRNPQDFALVVVADTETTTYLSRQEVLGALDEDLQAEVRFGLEQSETSADELLDNVRIFLAQGREWTSGAEKMLGEFRSEAFLTLPPSSVGLASAAPFEVEAIEAAWTGDSRLAGERHHLAAEALALYQDARGYRGYQLFLAAVQTNLAARETRDAALTRASEGLADQAVAAATPATWMRASMPLPGTPPRARSAADELAIDVLTDLVATSTNSAKHHAKISELREGLSAIDHKDYEPALSDLGLLLGAEASKPKGDGRADSTWSWGDHLWITLEAKSEHKPSGQIGLDDVRQANKHLTLMSDDRGRAIPPGSVSLLISPRDVFKRDALVIAEPILFKAKPEDLMALLDAVNRLWLRLITLRNIADRPARREAVADALADARLLPGDLLDRLTVEPVQP